ncbi:MAG: nicotinate-nucleotide adenylyltransferase, partial [Pyrinomonadaceae bacterium]
MDGRKRIAIYGGTFDPVHRGHVEVAKQTVELFGITELRFVPARQAPHKLEREVTPPLHRYAMLALATQNEPRLLVSSFEIDAPDRRYTIDTLAHFRAELEEDSELFFIMGADSWAEITTWREWERVVRSANHIVVTRPGYDVKLEHDGANGAAQIVDI